MTEPSAEETGPSGGPGTARGPRPRVLAVDYGKRRVGLALSDPTGTLATGLATLERRPGEPLPAVLERLVAEHGAGEVLLGLPLNMDGSRGPMAREVERLAVELRARLDVRVRLRDERLTTVRSYRVLRESGVHARAARGRVDRLSAVLMLQAYLDARASGERGAPAAGGPGRGKSSA
ncbi:MAG: Holliday junction resolvase RuvX [Gemmatimonadota bacterium]